MVKKIISVFLAVILICGTLTVAFAAEPTQDLPTIYIHGAGTETYNAQGQIIFPMKTDAKAIVEKNISELSKKAAKAILTDDWDDCANFIVDIIEEAFSPLKYNSDGTPVAENHFPYYNNYEILPAKTSNYTVYDYVFGYDWRDDPMEVADSLNTYIDAILARTGKSQVVIYAFSLGSCITAAYLTKYGSSKINSVILHSPAVNGVVSCAAPLAGKIKITANSIDNFVTNYQSTGNLLDDPAMGGLLTTLVTVLNKVNTLGLAASALDNFYKKIEEVINSRLGIATVGTLPSIWAMVNDDYYEEAKKITFAGKEDEYKGLIEKIDAYHYSVAVNSTEIFKSLKDEGKNVSVIAKYGVALFPLFDGCDLQADGIIALKDQSFGATAANIGKTLSDSYIKNAEKVGTAKYISADKIVDASTCLFPDSTWFIRGIQHSNAKLYADEIITKISKKVVQPTVWDDDMPDQFNVASSTDNSVNTITENNKPASVVTNWFRILFDFVKSFFNLIVSKFKK